MHVFANNALHHRQAQLQDRHGICDNRLKVVVAKQS